MTEPQPRRGRSFVGVLLLLAVVVIVVLVVRNNAPSTFGLAEEDWPRIILLGGILVFVGAGLFGRGLGASQVVRSVATWAVIFVVLVGLYASRDELAGLAGRVLGAIAPGVPISGRLTGEGTPESVAIVRSVDGHFAVRAEVEGKPLIFLFDTGASFVTLTSQAAAELGFDTAALRYVVPIHTANGTMTAAPLTIGRIAIGGIERTNVRALVAPPGALDVSLLGMTFLDTLGGYSISGDRLVLTP